MSPATRTSSRIAEKLRREPSIVCEATTKRNSKKGVKAVTSENRSKAMKKEIIDEELDEMQKEESGNLDATSQKIEENLIVSNSEDEDDSHGSNSSSSSSSSDNEDSDDDYEKEIGIKPKHSSRFDSSNDDSDHDKIDYLREIERKMDRKLKRSRLLEKRHKRELSDDDGIICEFESAIYRRNRKRRMFRRKIMRPPGEAKRRKIKRANVDVTERYTCDTFADFVETVDKLTTKLDLKDPDIDYKAVNRVFTELGIDGADSDLSSDEDEVDLVARKLRFYGERNLRERIDQVSRLEINPFVEKLAGYDSRKAEEGCSHSRIQSYHPDVLTEDDAHRLPESLIWMRPFGHLIYQETQFDEHAQANKILESAAAERTSMFEEQLLEGIRKRAQEKKELKGWIDIKVEPKIEDMDDDEFETNLFNRPSTSYIAPEEAAGMLDYKGNHSNDEEEEDDEKNALYYDDYA